MEYKSQEHNASFEISDRVTVREQLKYFDAVTRVPEHERFIKYWEGAKLLITKWQCPAMPDMNADIDGISDPQATSAIVWAGVMVKMHIDKLTAIPKNS